MKQSLIPTLFALLLGSVMTCASADTLYKCVGDGGVVLYTNQKAGAKKCVVLSRELPITTLATPARPARATSATPADFPRVDNGTQRGRDSDRRKILEQELGSEQQNLDKAKKSLAEGEATRQGDEKNYQKYLDRVQELKDVVALHERNIEAIKRELASVK